MSIDNALTVNSYTPTEVWDWCFEAYLHQGNRELKFPEHTDRSKTYQWRYIQRITDQLLQWELDRQTARCLIAVAIEYAREHKLLHKGLAILCQANILEICYSRLQRKQEQANNTIARLQLEQDWITTHYQNGDPEKVLQHRINPDAFCNLTRWYQQQYLSDLYLSLSAVCKRVLAKLESTSPVERSIVPNRSRLYLLRMGFLQNQDNLQEIRRIFNGDW